GANRGIEVRFHHDPLDQLNGYDGSLTCRASPLRASGLNVSTITASSSVRVASAARSRLPGWGPCTKPGGCKLIEPAPIPEPARLMKSPAEYISTSSQSTFAWWYGTFTAFGSKS